MARRIVAARAVTLTSTILSGAGVAEREGYDKAARIIDGRAGAKGHGGADMPVWSDAFKRAEEG